jgi:hypothetical protein
VGFDGSLLRVKVASVSSLYFVATDARLRMRKAIQAFPLMPSWRGTNV